MTLTNRHLVATILVMSLTVLVVSAGAQLASSGQNIQPVFEGWKIRNMFVFRVRVPRDRAGEDGADDELRAHRRGRGHIFRDAKLRANEFSAHRYYFYGSNRLRDIVFSTFSKYGIATFPDLQNGQGETNAVKEDAPCIQILRSPDDKHSDADTIDWVAAAGLEAVARAHARIIDDANKLDRKDLVPGSRVGTTAAARR